MSSVLVAVLALMVSLTVCQASPFFPFGLTNGRAHRMMPRCPSNVKPCRIKAELSGRSVGNQLIENQACSCASGKSCLSNWSSLDHVITRQLRTNGNITMTLSMMFCDAIQPSRLCSPGEVALQVKGYSVVPTEVEFIRCACADERPLVLHSRHHGAEYRQYDSYVCAGNKLA